MLAIRRVSFAVAVATSVAACVSSPAPTPAELPARTAASTPAATARPTPTATATAEPSAGPVRSPRPKTGFFFEPGEIVDYYQHGVGFACDPWSAATIAAHTTRVCHLADATNTPGEQVVMLTIDGDGALADILASYGHRDGSIVDRDAAMRFFVTVIGASFGGADGQVAAAWLTNHLGVPTASLDLRGLRFGTYLSDTAEGRGSLVFIEIATPAFGDATT